MYLAWALFPTLRPDAVIAAVAGSELACEILEVMHKNHWDNIPLLAVGADAFAQSVQANTLITPSKITSKATRLGTKKITPKLLE